MIYKIELLVMIGNNFNTIIKRQKMKTFIYSDSVNLDSSF
jgi:hypothetical protein